MKKKNYLQRTFFDSSSPSNDLGVSLCAKPESNDLDWLTASGRLPDRYDFDLEKLKNYQLEDYLDDIKFFGLKKTWKNICHYLLSNGEYSSLLKTDHFGELYEIGLAFQDKERKKNSGQYYTPDDVAQVMSQWLDSVEGENICDVACGTGNLILAYLESLGPKQARNLIAEGRVYLYDCDQTALQIAKTALLLKYGTDLENQISIIPGDFLNQNIHLPKNAKTISNPPYAAIPVIGKNWEFTDVLMTARDYYAVFMEKIIKQSRSAVIISPFSFISGNKFYPLRKILNNYQGKIYSFDNVPGNIFCGRKHGIFNSNTSNSVRAAITVIKTDQNRGFQLTPLIRFKNSERKRLIDAQTLDQFLPPVYQKITSERPMYYKCFKELEPLLQRLEEQAEKHTFQELVASSGGDSLTVPTTCRYYTVASAGEMKRNGQITLYFSQKDRFYYAFCLLNSSFAYWHWRLYDGGITYPKGLLMQMPSLFHRLTQKDHIFFQKTAEEMIQKAHDYRITKNNVGVQENIKYPREYRDRINQRILNILQFPMEVSLFDLIHSNTALEVNV